MTLPTPLCRAVLATLVFTGLVGLAGPAAADTSVSDAWIRGTVAHQKATGMYARITSSSGGKLVAARSPAAGVAEVHEMAMQGNTMLMRRVPALELPAGKTVALEPGGYHVMLMQLTRELAPGDAVPVTLVIETAGGRREEVTVDATVRALGAGGAGGAPAAPAAPGGHGAMKH